LSKKGKRLKAGKTISRVINNYQKPGLVESPNKGKRRWERGGAHWGQSNGKKQEGGGTPGGLTKTEESRVEPRKL